MMMLLYIRKLKEGEGGKKKAKEIAVFLDFAKVTNFFCCKNIFYTLEKTGFVKFLSKQNS
jgi:hypothetical protein